MAFHPCYNPEVRSSSVSSGNEDTHLDILSRQKRYFLQYLIFTLQKLMGLAYPCVDQDLVLASK